MGIRRLQPTSTNLGPHNTYPHGNDACDEKSSDSFGGCGETSSDDCGRGVLWFKTRIDVWRARRRRQIDRTMMIAPPPMLWRMLHDSGGKPVFRAATRP